MKDSAISATPYVWVSEEWARDQSIRKQPSPFPKLRDERFPIDAAKDAMRFHK
jgi:hypothetical protein